MYHVPDYQHQTRRYWFVDGIPELVLGLLFVLMSGGYVLILQLPERIRGIMIFVSGFLLIGAILLMRVVIRQLKQRVTYPRTGLLIYGQPPHWQRWLLLISGGIAGCIFGFWIVGQAVPRPILPVLTGGALAGSFFILGFTYAVMRYLLIAGWIILVTGIVVLLALASIVSGVLILGLTGSALILSGSRALWRYYQETSQEGES